MSWIMSGFKGLIPILITILGLEFSSSLYLRNGAPSTRDFSDYTDLELDTTLPFIAEANGASCILLYDSFNWNQWWGFNNKKLNHHCAKSFFSNQTYNVVFMGGSAMVNAEAPNYLTTVEYFSTSELDGVRSINLAESGARHKNMSIRFQREVIPLEPDLVIFFDGYNEFNSLLYNGNPYDDFYWTATGTVRMHHPLRLVIDKAIEFSSFFELALLHTGIYKSARDVKNVAYSSQAVSEASSTYLRDRSVTEALCDKYEIRCIFIIQPQVYGSTLTQHLRIISEWSAKFPLNERIRTEGYRRIIDGCFNCIDLSSALHDRPGTFLDPVHFGKNGSKLLGELIRDMIIEEIRKSSL